MIIRRYLVTSIGKNGLSRLKLMYMWAGFIAKFICRGLPITLTMLTSGISMVRALEITSSVAGNGVYENILKKRPKVLNRARKSAVFTISGNSQHYGGDD